MNFYQQYPKIIIFCQKYCSFSCLHYCNNNDNNIFNTELNSDTKRTNAFDLNRNTGIAVIISEWMNRVFG